MMESAASELEPFVTLAEYRAQRERFFPSPGALEWFCRENRTLLLDAGALVIIRGRLHAHPKNFDRVVVAQGQRLAAGQKTVS
jgi:hypothetical protein